jgi:PleD family two-component response regulator
MNQTAVFFGDANGSGQALQRLQQRCRREQFQVDQHEVMTEGASLLSVLPATPCVVFLPALKEDLLGVKLLQALRDDKARRVVCLYSDALPQPEYMALAFREGADDIIALDADEKMLDVQVARALRLVTHRMHASTRDRPVETQPSAPDCMCEKWKERLLALASTAGRIASGELWLSKETPELLIVTSSTQQGKAAAELAGRLGFAPSTASTAAQALTQAQAQPPRVVLADGTLPDSDVVSFAGRLRSCIGDKPVVIIAWSSSPQLERKVLVPGSGVDDFVGKGTTGQGRQLLIGALLGALR